MCSYMESLGKMMAGSGFEDMLIQSGLCASGSIDHVMTGKHYDRALHVHNRMLEVLDRMLLDVFFQINRYLHVCYGKGCSGFPI